MHSRNPWSLGGNRPRVLIAEDDTVTRLILKNWIIRWGYETVIVENGLDAWSVLDQPQPPEVVILDWDLPGLDGIELCCKLRDKSRAYYHYILMITGRTDEADLVHALESGADDCIGKPFGQLELRARLLVASRILALQNELIHAREEQRMQSMRDGLTGLWNRAAFLDLFRGELERARRSGEGTGLLLLDLDHFKEVNDTYGHPVGDEVLKETARRLQHGVRSYDFVGRYGGEEFLIAFPGASRELLCRRAEAIRKVVCNAPVHVKDGEVPISLSIGAVVAVGGKQSASEMVAVADVGLYKAKDSGRNRAVFCDKPWNEMAERTLTHRERCAKCGAAKSQECVISLK